MAKPKRKASKRKPITQHQLFPTVVALWFGALFGLGSAALRASLLEDLVMKSRIDLIIPAAAPPLGVTARILIALIMAVLGAMIGTTIARRLGQVRPVAHERKRTNLSTRDEGAAVRGYGSANRTAPPEPFSVSDAMGKDETGIVGAGTTPNRRRALAIEHEEDVFVPHELAPLPGGTPQIFDIAAAGLEQQPAAQTDTGPAASYGQTVQREPAHSSVALDWANAAPVLANPPSACVAQPAMVAPQLPHQHAASAPAAEVLPTGAAAVGVSLEPHATEDERQVFGMAPPAQAAEEQVRQIFGAPIADDHVPRNFVEQQGFKTTIFDAIEPEPLFAPREPNAFDPVAEVTANPASPAQPEVAVVPPALSPEPSADNPAGSEQMHAAPSAASIPEPEAHTEPLPSPNSLGIEDLSARLAESMRRRRAARAASAAQPDTVAVPTPDSHIQRSETTDGFEHAAGSGEPAAPRIPVAYEAEPVAPFVVPPFTVPEPEPAAPSLVEAAVTAVPGAAPAALPAALRPLDLSGFEEGDGFDSDSLLPPRHIVMPTPPMAAPSPFAAPVAAAPSEEEPEAADEIVIQEENYASLLAIAPAPAPANPFVRVEEPEDDSLAVEPVVIFPGQTPHSPVPIAVPSSGNVDGGPFRRFDAPASAGSGQPIATNAAGTAMNSDEAGQALRAALANLQRMSGAA